MSDHLDRLKAALANRDTIERELGSGGMATVYLAEDLNCPHVLPSLDSGEADGPLCYGDPFEGEIPIGDSVGILRVKRLQKKGKRPGND